MVFMPAPYPLEFRREAVALLKSSGKSVPQLANELGVSPQSLRNLEPPARCRRRSLERANERRARGAAQVAPRVAHGHRGARDPEKSGGLLRQGKRDPVRIFGFIAAKRAEHSIQIMCRVLEVSRSGFHAWANRATSARAICDDALSERIAEIHAESGKTYGSPRVQAELRLEDDVGVGRKRVEWLMRRAGLSGMIRRRRGKTTVSVPGIRTAPDLVERDFNPTTVNRLWSADVTYIRTWEG